jgi:hypothetical protein
MTEKSERLKSAERMLSKNRKGALIEASVKVERLLKASGVKFENQAGADQFSDKMLDLLVEVYDRGCEDMSDSTMYIQRMPL